jgi:endonuclease-3
MPWPVIGHAQPGQGLSTSHEASTTAATRGNRSACCRGAVTLYPASMPDPGRRRHERLVTRRIRTAADRLTKAYGPRTWRPGRSGLDCLVQTILSQNTSDANSSRAFESLRQRFPTWRQCLDAPVKQVEAAIRAGGLAGIKSRRIQRILRQILREHGALSLEFIRHTPLEQARHYLQRLDGVGPKTAACVLMFGYNRPALPVDTHVHRVARRLGLIADHTTAEAAHALLEKACPPRLIYPFHVLMVEHGRRTCRARAPVCSACCLADLCPSRNRLACTRPVTASRSQRRSGPATRTHRRPRRA